MGVTTTARNVHLLPAHMLKDDHVNCIISDALVHVKRATNTVSVSQCYYNLFTPPTRTRQDYLVLSVSTVWTSYSITHPRLI